MMSPRFQEGKYSKHFPKSLSEVYTRALRDPGLLSLNDEIAAIEAMIAERLSRIGESISNDWWAHIKSESDNLVRAQQQGNAEKAAEHLKELVSLIRAGSDMGKTMDEAADLMERKSRVVQKEWKRLVDMQHVLTADRAVSFVQSLSMSVKEHVKDRNAIRKIALDMEKILGVESKFHRKETEDIADEVIDV